MKGLWSELTKTFCLEVFYFNSKRFSLYDTIIISVSTVFLNLKRLNGEEYIYIYIYIYILNLVETFLN